MSIFRIFAQLQNHPAPSMNKVKSVLIVDDDRDDVDLFCEAIAEIDDSIECLSATDGEQALRVLLSKVPSPDFIFLDLNMPKLSGKQCLIEIKKSKKWRSIPVIIYTTSKNEEDKRETKKLGAAGFITKPSSYKDILRTLSRVLNGAQPER